jgi:hypothetical protein
MATVKISTIPLGHYRRRTASDELNGVEASVSIYDWGDCGGLRAITVSAGDDYDSAKLTPEQARALAAELLQAADIYETWAAELTNVQ